jgi:hypothetical protein
MPINTNHTGYSFYEYIQKQKACATLQHIPYLEQWRIQEGRITPKNYHIYSKDDGYHMTEAGYFDIGIHQLLFLAKQP